MIASQVLRTAQLVAVLMVAIQSTSGQRELCQAFIQEFNQDEFVVGSKRMVLFSKEKNWADAKAHCDTIGMRLLTTSTKVEVDLLRNYLNSRIWDGRPDVHLWALWLSATNLNPKGVWTWQTTGQNLTYTSWGRNEPSRPETANCAELKWIYFEETRWNDDKCATRKRYICETDNGGLN